MSDVATLSALSAEDIDALTALLSDAVVSGASVGYVLPVDNALIETYWRGIADEIAAGALALFAIKRDGRIIASAQLAFCGKPNGRHRAEVQKVLVHSSARRMGLGGALMRAVEQRARETARSLLVLDTETHSAGQKLYAAMGYQAAGVIPKFAIGNSGGFVPTTYMYKILDEAK